MLFASASAGAPCSLLAVGMLSSAVVVVVVVVGLVSIHHKLVRYMYVRMYVRMYMCSDCELTRARVTYIAHSALLLIHCIRLIVQIHNIQHIYICNVRLSLSLLCCTQAKHQLGKVDGSTGLRV